MRERDSAMVTVRQYDDDSATIRWRQCDNEADAEYEADDDAPGVADEAATGVIDGAIDDVVSCPKVTSSKADREQDEEEKLG
ncbi:hypothetical protein DPMN_024883, partial [Dreissena polymorpha]